MSHSTGFNADPVVSKPAARQRSSDAVGHPIASERVGLAQGASNGQSFFSSGVSGMPSPEATGQTLSGSNVLALPSSAVSKRADLLQSAIPSAQDKFQDTLHIKDPSISKRRHYSPSKTPTACCARYPVLSQASPTQASQLLAATEWGRQQSQLQQMIDQQALLSQLQTQMQLNQGMSSPQLPAQQSSLPELLAQQMQGLGLPQEGLLSGIESSHSSFQHQGLPALHSRGSSPTVSASLSSPALSDLQGLMHQGYGLQDDKKHQRGHSSKGRQQDGDVQQGLEKLKREVARLHGELERLEKDVLRQKSLRETERIEFTEAKDRLKHSWATDREDFARVKAMLKTKNSEHHAQSGRLSQQLKEIEAVNRGLRELCVRNGVAVPSDLEVTHSKHHTLAQHTSSVLSSSYPSTISSGAANSPASQLSISTSNPSSQLSNLMTYEVPVGGTEDRLASSMDTAYDSDLPEPLLGRSRWTNSQPPSPTSAASAITSMMQQLPQLLRKNRGDDSEHPVLDASDNEAAAKAAAQAATALGQLAAALRPCSSLGSKPQTPRSGSPPLCHWSVEDTCRSVGDLPVKNTDLNRASLQSWIHEGRDEFAGGTTPSSSRPLSRQPSSLGSLSAIDNPQSPGLEFPKVENSEPTTSPFEKTSHKAAATSVAESDDQ